jgi:hypothetical protein
MLLVTLDTLRRFPVTFRRSYLLVPQSYFWKGTKKVTQKLLLLLNYQMMDDQNK